MENYNTEKLNDIVDYMDMNEWRKSSIHRIYFQDGSKKLGFIEARKINGSSLWTDPTAHGEDKLQELLDLFKSENLSGHERTECLPIISQYLGLS